MELTTRTVYVNEKGFLSLLCPECGVVQKKEAAAYKDFRGPVDIQCNCGNIYRVEVEFRKECRKQTHLDGIYFTESDLDYWGRMIVKDLSLHGCKLEVKQKNPLKLNEEIRIEFRLNNAKNSLIKKRAIIRYINKNFIGCQFLQSPHDFDPDLGYYLRKL